MPEQTPSDQPSYWQHRSKGVPRRVRIVRQRPGYRGVVTQNMNDNLLMSVAHEAAHHVQRRVQTIAHQTHRKPHGDCFKWVYRQPCATIVNPAVEESRNRCSQHSQDACDHPRQSELFAVLSKKMTSAGANASRTSTVPVTRKRQAVTAELLDIIGALDEANRHCSHVTATDRASVL